MFKLTSNYKPAGDQPKAIKSLCKGLQNSEKSQVLLGATGSGKTYTIANVIAQHNKPTLVVSHNKTLAAQLFQEFKEFFPKNKVEYFVSYYDYYQPESYIPSSNKYIEKDLSINTEIEKLRLSTIATLASGRQDTIIISSVSCIYGLGNPKAFKTNILSLKLHDKITQKQILYKLVDMLYERTTNNRFLSKNFRVKGDTIEIYSAYAEIAYRITLWDDEIEEIAIIDPDSGRIISKESIFNLYPANLFVTDKEITKKAIIQIQKDLEKQIKYFLSINKKEEGNRIKERTELDIEMIREIGYCQGIENYSRYWDQRKEGMRPYCLIDYLPKDYLLVIDESHVSIPQIKAMYAGDRSRKLNLIEYGFRLPSALDNRPLKFEEFEKIINQIIFVSATPADYELEHSNGEVIEQIIRPTGLLDPIIEIKPSLNQIDDILKEIKKRIKKDERVLITTLTKKMAEAIADFLKKNKIKCNFIHSEIKTLERVDILMSLRKGEIDVIVGVNLLREGIDLPEVSLVIIVDADKEGLFRNFRALIQIIGRAARNKEGKVILYADKMTKSMEFAIAETSRRRFLQINYNKKHNIKPTTIIKKISTVIGAKNIYIRDSDFKSKKASDSSLKYMSDKEIKDIIKKLENEMLQAANDENFSEAIRFKEEILAYKDWIRSHKTSTKD